MTCSQSRVQIHLHVNDLFIITCTDLLCYHKNDLHVNLHVNDLFIITCTDTLGTKLSDPSIGHKNFWTAFKRITNKKKLTNIPPIFDNNTYVTNFQQKTKIFNDYFADQCKIHDNGSVLPEFISKTNASISYININVDQIVDIIQKYSSKKAHGCDDVSVAMLQLCASEVAISLSYFNFSEMYNFWHFSKFIEGCLRSAHSQKK